MSQGELANDLERRAIELTEEGKYSEARTLFEQAVSLRSEPLEHAKALRNVMLTYEKESNKEKAIAICRQILSTPGLLSTAGGTYFHGQMTSYLAPLEGRPTLRNRLSGCLICLALVAVASYFFRGRIAPISSQTREILGWIISALGALCALKVMTISARHRVPPELEARSPVESEYTHQQRLARNSEFQFYLWIGLGLLFLGMYLIGMFK